MNNFITLLKGNWTYFLNIILVLLLLKSGCTNSRISTLERKIDSNFTQVNQNIDSLFNNVQTTQDGLSLTQFETIMFKFLIFEDDLDKGKISLSDIENNLRNAKNSN
jgi:hypothetical protein